MFVTQDIKELGQHIKQWREIVMQSSIPQVVSILNKKHPEIQWTLSDFVRIEQGDSSLPFNFWLSIFDLMERRKNVIEQAHDLQGLFLAMADSTIDQEAEKAARNKLIGKSS